MNAVFLPRCASDAVCKLLSRFDAGLGDTLRLRDGQRRYQALHALIAAEQAARRNARVKRVSPKPRSQNHAPQRD